MANYIDPTGQQLQAFMTAPSEGPVVMINLLKFKPGGEESYRKYGEHTQPHLEKVGGKVIYQGRGGATVIGGDESWDLVLLVQYPSREKFFEMVQSPEYQEGTHLRTEALKDSRLYHTMPGDVMAPK